MLSDQVIQLLTAFVDGELSQRQRKAVMRLLHTSSEAREMLGQLQENAHKIKELPRHKIEPSLVDGVLQAIAERQAQPKPVVRPRRRRAWLPYIAASLAASLLIGAIGIVYWKVMNEPDGRDDGPGIVLNNGNNNIEKKMAPEPTPAPRKPNPLLAQITEGTFRDFGAPVLPEQAFTASFGDLKKGGKATGDLIRELNREKPLQFDITVKKNSDALTRLRMVLKDQGITLVTDPAAKKPLDDKKVEYLVYAENLTSKELTKLMNDLGESYVAGINNQQTVPSPYNKVTLTPLAQEDKQKVAKLLGVDAATMERKDAKPESKGERAVVLLPTTAGAQPSAEVRQFVHQRGGAQPGTIQVLIKIRQEK